MRCYINHTARSFWYCGTKAQHVQIHNISEQNNTSNMERSPIQPKKQGKKRAMEVEIGSGVGQNLKKRGQTIQGVFIKQGGYEPFVNYDLQLYFYLVLVNELMNFCDILLIILDKNPCKMFSNNLNYGSYYTEDSINKTLLTLPVLSHLKKIK